MNDNVAVDVQAGSIRDGAAVNGLIAQVAVGGQAGKVEPAQPSFAQNAIKGHLCVAGQHDGIRHIEALGGHFATGNGQALFAAQRVRFHFAIADADAAALGVELAALRLHTAAGNNDVAIAAVKGAVPEGVDGGVGVFNSLCYHAAAADEDVFARRKRIVVVDVKSLNGRREQDMDAAVVQGDGVRRDAAFHGPRGPFGGGHVHAAAVQGKAAAAAAVDVIHRDTGAAADVQFAGAAKGKAALLRVDAAPIRDGEGVCAAQLHRHVTAGADAGVAGGRDLRLGVQPLQRHGHRRTVPPQADEGGTAAGKDSLVGLRLTQRAPSAKQLHGAPA